MATYYVDQKHGNDSNSGLTAALAKRTIEGAVSVAGVPSTINVLGGEYHEILTQKYLSYVFFNNAVLLGDLIPLAKTIHFNTGQTLTGVIMKRFSYFLGSETVSTYYISYSQFINGVFGYFGWAVNCMIRTLMKNIVLSTVSSSNIIKNVKRSTFYVLTNPIIGTSLPADFNYNLFVKNLTLYITNTNNILYQGFLNCQFKFTSGASFAYCKTAAELRAKRDLDLSVTTDSSWYETCTFIDHSTYDEYDVFNNPDQDDFTLKPYLDIAETIINPFAIGTYELTELGAYGVSLNWLPADFTADANGSVTGGLHKTGGTNSVFTSDAKSFAVARQIKKMPISGQLWDRDGVVLCPEAPSAWPYERPCIAELAWSATLSSAALDSAAGSTVPYLKFKLDREMKYVDNGGTLVGNGDTTYLGLVDATDGGSGSLAPNSVIAKSLKPRVTIYNE